MPDIFKIYEWLFEGILWIPVIAILLLVLSPVLFGVGKVLFYAVGFVMWVLGGGAPIIVPLFIYYAGIYESPWFPRLAQISAILGLFIWPACIYSYFECKKEDKAKKDGSSEEVGVKETTPTIAEMNQN